MSRALAFIALAVAAACGRHINPEWCAQPGHSDPQCGGLDGNAQTCGKDEDCTNGLVCDTTITGGACVQCTEGKVAACSPPVCVMDRCAACATDAECASQVCLPSGACAAASTVLYVSPTGTSATCTQSDKCTLGTALGLAVAGRNTISLDAGTYKGALTLDRSVVILGRAATLDANGPGPTVSITNNATVELDFVTITKASGASGLACVSGVVTGHGITVTANQFGVTSACALALDRSQVTHNQNGALDITGGSIDVRNNFFVNNGDNALMANRNVTIGSSATGAFVFNTVAYNVAKSNSLPGIACSAVSLNAEGNLVTDNNKAGMFNVSPQVSGSCDFSKSYTRPGAGNNDLKWVDVTSDFHLTPASTPVLDVATASCAGLSDYDGESRPMGAGCDFGADELKP